MTYPEQQHVGETVTPISDAMADLHAISKAKEEAKRAMDAAWAHYCTAKQKWERHARETSEVFERLWGRLP